jgi:type I restriction enzyme R subunit
MLMLAHSILNKYPESTIIVITDRNSLDKQLFARFTQASDYLMSIPEEIKSRKDLVNKLENKKHFGIYFTTVQKFSTETGSLSNRDNIFILVDEAHRSQNNIEGEKLLSRATEEFVMKFGYARYMRDAFPNAKLTGFTGTPLMGLDRDTSSIFGDYTHIYSMNDSVRNGSTVPIKYESRKLNVFLKQEFLDEMDKLQYEYAKTLDANNLQAQQKMDTLLKSVQIKAVLEDKDVIYAKTQNILEHLKMRAKVLHGKAMIVASTRKAAYEYYKAILKIEPERKCSTILVMTHSNKDKEKMSRAIVEKVKINHISAEFRKDDSKLKIAIVVDM